MLFLSKNNKSLMFSTQARKNQQVKAKKQVILPHIKVPWIKKARLN